MYTVTLSIGGSSIGYATYPVIPRKGDFIFHPNSEGYALEVLAVGIAPVSAGTRDVAWVACSEPIHISNSFPVRDSRSF